MKKGPEIAFTFDNYCVFHWSDQRFPSQEPMRITLGAPVYSAGVKKGEEHIEVLIVSDPRLPKFAAGIGIFVQKADPMSRTEHCLVLVAAAGAAGHLTAEEVREVTQEVLELRLEFTGKGGFAE